MKHDSSVKRLQAATGALVAGTALSFGLMVGVASATTHGSARVHHRGASVHHHGKHAHSAAAGAVTSVPWGSVNGQSVKLYTLSNASGMKVDVSNYGGVVQSIWVPDRAGKLVDVALGFPTLADYVSDFTQGVTSTPWPESGGSGDTYFGALVGRYANRIANGAFSLNGTTYKLDINNGVNSLHGGYLGWNTKVWNAGPWVDQGGAHLTLTASFPAGEGCLPSLSPGCTGYPAPIKATVSYTVTPDSQLKISYAASNESTTQATVINLTNHTYFNLGGEASGDVYGQQLALNSDEYTPTNATQIPEAPYFVPVAGTAYDFRSMHPIGKYITDTSLPDGTSGPLKQLQIAHGYDNNWVLNDQGSYRLGAVAEDQQTGITLWEYTDQPGVQLYTGNFLVGDLIGTSGSVYRQGAGFTLETQHYPDSPNHIGQSGWPSVVLDPGATFNTHTAYAFGVEPANYPSKVQFK